MSAFKSGEKAFSPGKLGLLAVGSLVLVMVIFMSVETVPAGYVN